MKNIGVFITEYSLLIFLLIYKRWDQVTFIFWDTRIQSDVMRRLKKCGARGVWGEKTATYRDQIKNKQQRLIKFAHKIFREILRIRIDIFIKCYPRKSVCAYGQDHSELAAKLRSYNFTVIEDGLANYFEKDFLEHVYKTRCGMSPDESLSYLPFGWDDSISRIYLAGRAPVPKGIKEKCEIFDIRALWNGKTEEEKRKICYVFGFDLDYILDIVRKGRDIFLLTQNYAPALCTEEQQVSIYRKLLSKYDLRRVVIKTHPGDSIAYEKYFRDCLVMRENFPFELMYFMQIPIQKIIGIDSTALYGLWEASYIESHEEIGKALWKKVNM